MTATAGDLLLEQLEYRRPALELEDAFAAFLEHLHARGEDERFHPHPFTRAAAGERARYAGRDVYCLAVLPGRVLGYGMLRGWDEGYAIPSLGIAVHAEARSIGLGRALMLYLHAEATRRGAEKIRLKVYPDNEPAVRLYQSLGYVFQPGLDHEQLVGFKQLRPR